MPLAKSATVEETPKPIITQNPPDSISHLEVSSVSPDMYSFFSLPLSADEKDVNKLKVISDWAKAETNGGSDGDMLQKVCDLRTKLGYSGTDNPIDKIFNYCRMTMYMREIEKRRDALSRRF